MLKFVCYPTPDVGAVKELHGAHLLGADGVPARGEIRVAAGVITCESRAAEPLAISLLWPVRGAGVLQLETTRLPASDEPYHLHVELARHRLMRISVKREEWGLFDYSGMDEISAQLDLARDKFIAALQSMHDPKAAAVLADESLSLAVRASEQMARFHAAIFLGRRQQGGGLAGGNFGAAAPVGSIKPEALAKLRDLLDYVRIPFSWHDVQPKEQGFQFDGVENWFKTCAKAGLAVRGGPLLSFGVASVPDWLYIYENDYEAITEFAKAYLRQAATKLSSYASSWVAIGGAHADSAFSLNFEQIMDLTRTAVGAVRQAAPKAAIVVELTQPWGEYYARNTQTIPPLLYADMLMQAGINFDIFGLQILMGIDGEGYHVRDMLQISTLIDRLANFGKPISITAAGVPASGNAGGEWGGTWSPERQAEWFEQLCEIALSKPFVDSVCFQALVDGPASILPGGGLLTDKLARKPAYDRIKALRDRVRGGAGK